MTRQHDQQCQPMPEVKQMLGDAWYIFRKSKSWGNFLEVLHKTKNYFVEKRRWVKGECDEHEGNSI